MRLRNTVQTWFHQAPWETTIAHQREAHDYWVWKSCIDTNAFSEVVVATDDERIKTVVDSFGGRAIMTSSDCDSPSVRTWMIPEIVEADYYVRVNGDEPLLRPDAIVKCIPENVNKDSITVTNLMTHCTSATDVIDVSNIKVVTDNKGYGLYITRSPVPFPKGNSNFDYMKFVGVTGLSKGALDFFHATPRGRLEDIEDLDELQFIEHGKKVRYIEVESDSFSIDTHKDLMLADEIMRIRTRG